jgi:DNA-binding PadR family transcriptional regulator
MHGHRIRSEVEELSSRPIGPGTLYGAINRLEEDGLVRQLVPEGRRRPYEITPAGRRQLADAVSRSRAVVEVAERRLRAAAWTG